MTSRICVSLVAVSMLAVLMGCASDPVPGKSPVSKVPSKVPAPKTEAAKTTAPEAEKAAPSNAAPAIVVANTAAAPVAEPEKPVAVAQPIAFANQCLEVHENRMPASMYHPKAIQIKPQW